MRPALVVGLCLVGVTTLAALAERAATAERSELAERAATLLARRDAEQRQTATWSFDADEREDVSYAPIFLDGLPAGDLTGPQTAALDALLEATLSPRGLRRVREIRDLELAVASKESGSFFGLFSGSFRDPDRYLLAVFGEPSSASPWAYRFEGHHLSLNVTSAPGAAPATTPWFLGAEPRRVPEGWPSAGVAVLGPEEELARALVASLSAEQRGEATLELERGRALMLGEVRRVDWRDVGGLRRGSMTPSQQVLLDRLVESFVADWSEPIAAARRAEIAAAGRDELRFVWAEGDAPPNAFYLRVSGPRFLLELDNTEDGDHVHAVWHDREGDFGDDLLARHYREAHGVEVAALTSSEEDRP
jgi:hypothetical protein